MLVSGAIHLVQGLRGLLSRKPKQPRCVVPRAHTADCPPPTKPNSYLEIGKYCIHASSNLYDNTKKEIHYVIGGYDDNPGIADKVDRACVRVRDNLNGTGDVHQYECVDHRLFFMGEREPCSGQIYLMSKEKDIITHLNSII